MPILDLFRRKKPFDAAAHQLYVALITQSRQPAFYESGGVPDTIDGRFDLLAVHAFLLMRRLGDEGPDAAALSQSVFDLMFADMDQSLREMGVSDIRVGTKVMQMAEAFYGRVAAYHAGLDGDAAALAEGLRRNLFRKTDPSPEQVAAMADYLSREASSLSAHPLENFLKGQITFGSPVTP